MADFNLRTLNDVTLKLTSRGRATAILWRDSAGTWNPISSDEVYGRIRALANAFERWGIQKGDRVAILSENRWEWAISDLAALSLGAVDVPLYATNTPEQVGYMLRDSGAKLAIVSSREQYAKLFQCGDLPSLEHIVIMDEGSFDKAESFSAVMQHAPGLQSHDAEFSQRMEAVQPEDLATIIYTSGTTGEPKGVRLTHGNLASNLNTSTTPFRFSDQDSYISFLPLSHVTARHVDYALMCHGAQIAYCPRFELLPKAMQSVRPTIFVGVPRVYEKIRQAAESKSAHSPLKRRIFKWAHKVGEQQVKQTLEGTPHTGLRWHLANKLVFLKLREAFGGRACTFISGGAPLGMDSASWFANAGIRIFEGYGLTETSPVISLNNPTAHCIGSVGKPLPNVQVRCAPDGEVEASGPSIFSGYWNKEKENLEAFTADGWFRTGDIGRIEDGFLFVTDRKKELIKTSGGKFVPPQPIENKLKSNSLIAQAAVVGDKHKFVSVLLSPNFDALQQWASGQGIATQDKKALVTDSKVLAEYRSIVNAANRQLAPYETMKRICVVPDEWSVETGELTPSMKLKRRVIEGKYADEIAAFYRDEATAKG